MNAKNIQQAVPGFKTVEIVCGCMTVRVHEALDAMYQVTPHRYFLSVDFKFKPYQILNIGTLGLLGTTKSEATREARSLAQRIHTAKTALDAATALASDKDTATNRMTVKVQAATFDRIVSKYSAEIIP